MDQTGHSAGGGGVRIAMRRRGRNLHKVPSNLRPSPKRCVVRARAFSGEHNGMHTDLVPIPDPLQLRRQPLSKGRISQGRGKVSEAHDKRSPHRMGKFEEHASWPHGAYASRKGASSGPTHPMENIRGRSASHIRIGLTTGFAPTLIWFRLQTFWQMPMLGNRHMGWAHGSGGPPHHMGWANGPCGPPPYGSFGWR